MTLNDGSVLIVFLVLVALAVALVAPRSAARRRAAGDAWARRNLAYVEPRFVPELDRWFARRMRRGGAMLLIAGLLISVLPGSTYAGDSSASWWAVLIIFGSASTLLSALDFSRPFLPSDRPLRRARLRAVSLEDFVPPSIRATAWAGAAVSLANGSVVALADGGSPYERWMLVLCSVMVAAGLGAAEWAGHHIPDRPEPAEAATDLYWQDAVRAESIQGGFRSVALWSAQFAWASSRHQAEGALAVVNLLGGVGLLGLFFADWVRYPNMSWPRRRLWPDLADGQVLLPQARLSQEDTP